MSRLVVYGRSGFCPDMMRWSQWVKAHPIAFHEFDIDADEDARDFVVHFTGHLSVPTLVIAPQEHFGPIEAPAKQRANARQPSRRHTNAALRGPFVGQVDIRVIERLHRLQVFGFADLADELAAGAALHQRAFGQHDIGRGQRGIATNGAAVDVSSGHAGSTACGA